MKHYRTVLAALAVMTLAGSAAYSFVRTQALENRLRAIEARLQTAERRIAAASQPVSPLIGFNPPYFAAPASAPNAVIFGNSAGPATTAIPEDRPGLDQRLSRVEKELKPHVTLIDQISTK